MNPKHRAPAGLSAVAVAAGLTVAAPGGPGVAAAEPESAEISLAWQSTDPAGTPVVRERYWITMQPGEIRVCDGCHGVNTLNQAGQPPAQNTATAFRELLHDVKDAVDFIFDDGFGD